MSATMKMVPKEARPVVRQAMKDGWSVKLGGGGHLKLSKPGCRPVFLAASPSDRKRTIRNLLADIKRSQRGDDYLSGNSGRILSKAD